MEMDNERSSKEEDEVPVSSKAELIRAKLRLVGHYLMPAIAPVVSVLALIVAVMAYSGNQANRAQLNEASARIDSIGAIQSETKGELDIFKVPLAREKSLLAEDRKRQAEREAVIVENVSRLQIKMKVSPTLEEQLREGSAPYAASAPAASAPAAAPVAATAPVVVAPVPPKVETKTVVQPTAPVRKTEPVVKDVKKPVPAVKDVKKPATAAKDAKKPAPTAKDVAKKSAPTSAEKTAKAQALKKTIEEFNKSDKK